MIHIGLELSLRALKVFVDVTNSLEFSQRLRHQQANDTLKCEQMNQKKCVSNEVSEWKFTSMLNRSVSKVMNSVFTSIFIIRLCIFKLQKFAICNCITIAWDECCVTVTDFFSDAPLSIVVTTSIFIVHDKKENRKNYHNLCEIKVNKHDWSMKPTKHVIHLPFQFMPRMGERMMNRTTWLRKVFIDCRLPHVVCLLNVCSISIYIYQFSHVTVDIAYFIENCAVFFFCGG